MSLRGAAGLETNSREVALGYWNWNSGDFCGGLHLSACQRKLRGRRYCAAFSCVSLPIPAIASFLILTLDARRQTGPLKRCERADVSAQLAATGSLDLSSVALRNVICSLQDAGAGAAFC